ncbi:MAG: Smr/MutS family protein [Succinivibrio sp.]
MKDALKNEDFSRLLDEEEEDGVDFAAEAGPVARIKHDTVDRTSPLLDPRTSKIRQDAATKVQQQEVEGAGSGFVRIAEPNEVLEFLRPGVQPFVLRKLRTGDYAEADFIDLHGCTIEQAYDRVMRFIARSRDRGFRCVLIIHGKGELRRRKAVIKSYVAHWLRQLPDVLAFHSAPEWKGGTGSVMVILRKNEKASAENREFFARRR